jgi:hypothetical protein
METQSAKIADPIPASEQPAINMRKLLYVACLSTMVLVNCINITIGTTKAVNLAIDLVQFAKWTKDPDPYPNFQDITNLHWS